MAKRQNVALIQWSKKETFRPERGLEHFCRYGTLKIGTNAYVSGNVCLYKRKMLTPDQIVTLTVYDG